MEKIFLLNEELNAMTDTVLKKNFNGKPPIHGKVNYYPIFASRLPTFKELLFDEAIKPENMAIPLFNFIKACWLPVICVLDYSNDHKVKKEIINHIKEYWSREEIDNFKEYFKTYSNWYELF